MNPFDICIAYVSWENGGKRRPVLLITKGDEYTEAYRITSQYASKSEAVNTGYFKIGDWKQAGLAKPSYVDTITPVELPTERLSPPIGKLSDNDKLRLIEFLNN